MNAEERWPLLVTLIRAEPHGPAALRLKGGCRLCPARRRGCALRGHKAPGQLGRDPTDLPLKVGLLSALQAKRPPPPLPPAPSHSQGEITLFIWGIIVSS
ncbi:hypothetical protein SKAU_G00314490 [Synaphobranchus kaupii]|uniref:Uncharacterized protein n=1 Tax=Synaphobranchus kaupii TaxID=118154 RepID=A0A9Q1ESB3_SYNKA|nr:hypothetical protein SKAU_G00314490 [Synaphobranchus kaupii]